MLIFICPFPRNE